MPLLPLSDIRVDLTCPCCGGPFATQDWSCTKCLRIFPVVQGTPILVDFNDSVLSPSWVLQTGGATLVKRNRPQNFRTRMAHLLRGTNAVACENIQSLISMSRQRCQRPRVLVVGGGTIGSGISCLYTDPSIDVIAFDVYSTDSVQFIADAHSIPLRNGSVDAVVVQAVLEHVIDPRCVVSEIERVLPQGGVVYSETPFLQHVHEGPYDFCRFTESGHRYLFRRFHEIKAGAVAGAGAQMLWSVEYLVRSLFRSRSVGYAARLACFWLRWLDRLIPEEYAIDSASGCYFLGTKCEETITPRGLIARYMGAQKP
jgi:SAM-dependent methyltransferase